MLASGSLPKGAVAIPVAGGAQNADCGAGNFFIAGPMTGNLTLSFQNMKPGEPVFLRFQQDGVGARTLAIANPALSLPSGVTIVPVATANVITCYVFIFDSVNDRVVLFSKVGV